ncbi:MAG: RecB family exonuclease [Capsulimonadaceae bacterium]
MRKRPARKPEISPTRLRTFLTCPMMYRLEYIDKVGRFYHRAQAGYAFGTSLHQTLQAFHQDGGTGAVTPQGLADRLEEAWIERGYANAESEQEHRVAAERILETYYATAAERADSTRTFLTEKMLKYDMGPFVLTGRIDRIDEYVSDGALEIVDYKSGRTSVDPVEVKEALAMSVYQLLVKRLYPDRRVTATIHALLGGVTASASYTDDEMAELEDDLRGIGITIIETDFEAVHPIPLPDTCPDCDFLRICTRYWRKERIDYRAALDRS